MVSGPGLALARSPKAKRDKVLLCPKEQRAPKLSPRAWRSAAGRGAGPLARRERLLPAGELGTWERPKTSLIDVSSGTEVGAGRAHGSLPKPSCFLRLVLSPRRVREASLDARTRRC